MKSMRHGTKNTTNDGGIADGYLKFWMALEFNRNAGHKIFGSGKSTEGNPAKNSMMSNFAKFVPKVRFTKSFFTESASIS